MRWNNVGVTISLCLSIFSAAHISSVLPSNVTTSLFNSDLLNLEKNLLQEKETINIHSGISLALALGLKKNNVSFNRVRAGMCANVCARVEFHLMHEMKQITAVHHSYIIAI